MTWAILIAVALPLASATNALVLAGALVRRSVSPRRPAGLYGAALLSVGAFAMMAITLEHSGLLIHQASSALIEGSLTLASGPLLVLFACRMLGLASPGATLFAPLGFYLLLSLCAPEPTLDNLTTERLVLVQMAYTAGAAVCVWRTRPPGARARQARQVALAVVAMLAIIHLAQVARMTWPALEQLRNVVPLAAAACFTVLAALVYSGVRGLDMLAEGPPVRTRELDRLADDFDAMLAAGRLRDPGLSVASAAAELGAPVARLSEALETARGARFPAYLQQLRVAEAQRLMVDPAEARTSMEAVGLLAGFGSRSAFYAAFRDRVGLTPAAWRAREAGKTCPEGDSGQD